jgi:hypothetical protein
MVTYLERGQPVTVLTRWHSTGPYSPVPIVWHRPARQYGPRNVLICRQSGQLVVRPFRGLRKPKETADA